MAKTGAEYESLKLAIGVGSVFVPIILGLVIYIYHRQVAFLVEKLSDMKEVIKAFTVKVNENDIEIEKLHGEIKTQIVVCNERHKEK